MTPRRFERFVTDASKRDVVSAALAVGDEFKSAQDLHASLRVAGHNVLLTTIYRILQQSTANGDIDILCNENGEARHRSCSQTHQHHLVCRMCGKTVEVKGPAVGRWTASMATQHGYRNVSHTVEILGICADHKST